MFIDYVPMLLINMVAGLFVLAYFVYSGMVSDNLSKWAPAFFASGLIAFVAGLYMTVTWPLPGSYNVAYGELSVIFVVIFLAAAISTAKNWDLKPVTVYAFFGGVLSVLIGIRIILLGLTTEPIFSGIGFILTGMSGIFACIAWKLKHLNIVRILGSIVTVAAALIWAITGYMAYWAHMSHFIEWAPIMK